MSRAFACLLAGILMLQVPGIARAELPDTIPLNRSFYITMDGERQGRLTGSSVNPTKGREGWMDGFWLEHGVHIPLADSGGARTGQRVHKPVFFVKPFDAASPLLSKALSGNELMKSVRIDFVRTNATGAQVNYGRIELSNAQIVNVRRFTQGNALLEEVVLVYQKIRLTFADGAIIWEDTWSRTAGP